MTLCLVSFQVRGAELSFQMILQSHMATICSCFLITTQAVESGLLISITTTYLMSSIGTGIVLHNDQSKQVIELNPYRGYLSSVENRAHFGLGDNDKVDSIKVYWPDGKSSLHKTTVVDTLLTLSYPEASAVGPLIANRVRRNHFICRW